MSKPVFVPDELAAAIQDAAQEAGRSMDAQAELWLEAGKAIHELGERGQSHLGEALHGERAFNELTTAERAMYRVLLEFLTFHPEGVPGVQERMRDEGTPFVVLDDKGQVVEIQPDGSDRVITDVDSYGHRE